MITRILLAISLFVVSIGPALAQRAPSPAAFVGALLGTGVDPLTWGSALVFFFVRRAWWLCLAGALAANLAVCLAFSSFTGRTYPLPVFGYELLATAVWFGIFSGIRLLRRRSPRAATLPVPSPPPDDGAKAKTAYDEGDYAAAVRGFRRLADYGNSDAQFNLGVMYADGRGVPQDFVQAHFWLNLAASLGDVEASAGRDLVAARMTPGQIAEAQKLASQWRSQ